MSTDSDWKHVPVAFQYLRDWASRYGLRGLTIRFGQKQPINTLASEVELIDLSTAYETIATRGDGPEITAWCVSNDARRVANEAKEQIRGLLLLFERLADYGIAPFSDSKVRFTSPEPGQFDWNALPMHLQQWKPWLTKFAFLRTEENLFQYVNQASDSQVRELAALKVLLDSDGELLSCLANFGQSSC
jgi:hypothetical protein